MTLPRVADKPAYKLPDVKLMNISDCFTTRHQTGSQGVSIDMFWDAVEEDQGGLAEEGPGAGTHQEDQQEGEDGVQVVLVLPVCQPDDGGADQDHHTAQGVRHDVEEDALDVELLSAGDGLLTLPRLVVVRGLISALTVIMALAKYQQSD